MKFAASMIQKSSTPGLAITRTKPSHERRVRMQFFLDPFLDACSKRVVAATSLVASTDLARRNFTPREEHEHEAEHFHGGLDVAVAEKGGKAGEGDGAIDDFHDGRAEPDQDRPLEAAPRAFVHDGEVDRADRNGKEQAADETRSSSDQQDGLAAPTCAVTVRGSAVVLVVLLLDFVAHPAGDARPDEAVNQIER